MTDPGRQIAQLAADVGAALANQRLVLATAESCTASGLAYAVTMVPGSSAWFDRGFITYSNESKTQLLDVSTEYLRDFGAVSEQVARAMALGALSRSAAQVAVAVTGVAGPDGGTPDKPVGTVCFAWAIHRAGDRAASVQTSTQRFSGDRAAVRTGTIIAGLETLGRLLHAAQYQPLTASADEPQ